MMMSIMSMDANDDNDGDDDADFLLTCCVTDITVNVKQSPPDLMRSTTCLCVAPSTLIPFL